jgi:hypothetical protein
MAAAIAPGGVRARQLASGGVRARQLASLGSGDEIFIAISQGRARTGGSPGRVWPCSVYIYTPARSSARQVELEPEPYAQFPAPGVGESDGAVSLAADDPAGVGECRQQLGAQAPCEVVALF